ncbi:MAG: (2Fe-2S)-binding protein [Flaviaesturariibacter sp.]|nr:(2Fe-2S)-binding protein [Flaviaesturariibacter sp.]
MVQFILNNSAVTATQADGSTVLDYIRYHKRLMGTKIGCREGDCGACTILVGGFEDKKLVYRSMTSCLMPLGNAQGKHIVTVEGINQQELTPVQQAMVDTNGTQCGFCTLGFVMSFTGLALQTQAKSYPEAIAAIDGNICRCTGYKSIERSAKLIAEKLADKPQTGTINWLIEKRFLPPYFSSIEERLLVLNKESITAHNRDSELNIAGGTDLLVQRPLTVKKARLQTLFGTEPLKGIWEKENNCHIGGGVTVSEFLESGLIKRYFPELPEHIKLVSSTPIRNMATLAGNLVNASPIGDMTVFFLALNAGIVLSQGEQKRTIRLSDFYKGYKQKDLQPGELITQIYFAIPGSTSRFSFEKVSKRTNLDIASVNSACQVQLQPSGAIGWIHVSAGGVAPFPKYLSQTCSHLQGNYLNEEVLREALRLAASEIAPISDARGSSDYKRLLLRQLLLAHFLKVFGPIDPIKNLLFE